MSHFQTILGGKPLTLGASTAAATQFNYYGDGFAANGATGFGIGYDAVMNTGKRKLPLGRVLSEDWELRQLPRRQAITNARDLARNFAIVAWAIRQHLDYVSTFHFRSKTGNKKLDQQIEDLMEWYGKKENCDPGARHRLSRLVRLWECLRMQDGDVLINRLADGRIQTIEGDRIQSFGGIPYFELGIDPIWVVNGVYLNQSYRAKAFMVFRRPPQWTGLLWDRAVPAYFAELFGYFERRYDQVRGISPILAAANSFRDLYENIDYALIKAKVSQFFALATTRQGSEELGSGPYPETLTGTDASVIVNPPLEVVDPGEMRYNINFGHRGATMVDLDPGDEIKVIESETPSQNFQDFNMAVIQIALKSLDIPMSMFDESFTNFSGSRLAMISYEKSATIKRGDLREQLNILTDWRLGLFVRDGWLKLPSGWKVSDLRYEWAHAGTPWYDPMKEVTAAISAVNAGFSSPQRECKKLGVDFFEIIDERKAAEDYADKQGVILSTAIPSTVYNDPNASRTKTEDQNIEEADPEDNGGRAKPAKPAKPSKNGNGKVNGNSRMSQLGI